ncbi:filamentous hemagglutinin N-terminal domain-containing protein [Candidatus Synechococcus calcipolaris G9]|uniref:Filamentous hemagglutinin N-terminal domain-containing protein n=1 Tax=Candidatus Synechococcus calcipolaris G9 TaxID=1497997 RepID=A0ABT6F262_9SYNE|nr:filamentous hemagglutinin N-terminal domain-containing protein [Candidatus Synechococcus calcipolaris]MDG2991934.1 filamentous hemagglutinin N-terminal domain-containing protein [Candidatus Synechococcus calcipolaris G9]
MLKTIRQWFTPVAVLGCLLPSPALAQITPAVGGTGTVVTVNGQQFDIGGGAFSRDGQNLFHLFQKFGLNEGQIANFLSNSKVQNILAGVNGGDVSYINGLIQVMGGNSNLYLLNPAGIVFGPNAQLNVPAAFHASTAQRVHFDGGIFDINGFNDYANLVGNPTGFEFLSTGIIVNEGNLAVSPGQNLTLMGHQVFNTGTLSAPGGTITIQAVPETGMVRISQEGMILSLEIPADRIPEDGVIEAVDLPRLITGGEDRPRVNSVVHNADGSISLVHDPNRVNVPVEGATAVASGTFDVSNPEGLGGQINVLGQNVAMLNAQLRADGETGGGTILGGGDYLGGSAGTGRLDSSFNAQNLFVDSNTVMNADAVTQGNGGTVINWADNSTVFQGMISARGGALGGDGGFVETSGREVLHATGRVDASAPLGNPGVWLLDPFNVTISDSTAGGSFNSGSPNIFTPNADNATVLNTTINASLNGGTSVTITTGLTGSPGAQAGNIRVNAPISKTMGGNATLLLEAANNIEINSPISLGANGNLTLQSGGSVTQNGAGVITANGLELLGAGTFTLTNTSNDINTLAGNTTGAISFTDANSFTVGTVNSTTGIQSAGNITLSALGTGNITVQAGINSIQSTGGITTLDAANDIFLGTASNFGDTRGQKLVLNAGQDLVIANQTFAQADGSGGIEVTTGRNFSIVDSGSLLNSNGGNAPINIEVGGVFTLNSVTSGVGANNGNITITTDQIALTSGTIGSTGQLLIQPLTPTESIGIGTGAAGTLRLDTDEIGRLGNGFSQITIGSATGSGNVDIRTAAFQDNVLIRTPTGTGTINLNGNLSTGTGTEAGTITLQAGESIIGNSGSSITTQNQAITLNSDRDATNGGAIQLIGTNITSNGGNITLGGGADPSTTAAIGTAANNIGIELNGANLNAGAGSISLQGQGFNSGSNNYGIYQHAGAQVSTTSGNITYSGEGGTGGQENFGIFLSGTGSSTTSTTGTINLMGTSVATTGGSNSGIRLVNGQVSGGGNISLTGTGGNGDSFNDGIVLLDNTLVQGDGNASITLTGTGGLGTGNLNRGIVQQNGARVITANGNIIYSGEGGSGVNTNLGIDLTGASTTITSGAGDISLTGTGGGSGGFNYGIFQQLGAQVFTGTGNISYEGTGSGTADSIRTQDGSNLIGNGTTSGNITLTALTNGITLNDVTLETTGDIQINSPGNVTQSNSSLLASGLELLGAGNFTLNSETNNITTLAGNTTGAISFTDANSFTVGTVNTVGLSSGNTIDLQAISGNITLASNTPMSSTAGPITLQAGESIFGNSGSSITTQNQAITLNSDRDETNGGAINLTGTTITSNGGNITLGGGADPSTTAAVGTSTNNVGIELNGANLTAGAGDISLRGQGFDSGSNNYGISQQNAAQVSTTSGNISYDGEGGTGGLENFGIFLSGTGSSITSTTGIINLTGTSVATTGGSNSGIRLVNGQVSGGGNISLTGTGGNGDSFNDGVVLLDNALIQGDGNASVTLSGTGGLGTGNLNRGIVQQNGARVITANGNIIYSGTGGNGTNDNYGIYLDGTNTQIRSDNGAISLTGTGQGSGTNNHGIFQEEDAQVSTTGTGNITYDGTGGNGTNDNYGIYLSGANTTVRSTLGGNISLTGIGQGTTTFNFGIFQSEAQVTTTNNGTITYMGTGANGTSGNIGTYVIGSAARITTVDGAISLTGFGQGSQQQNFGIYQVNGAQVISGAGNITYAGTGGDGTGGNSVVGNHGIHLAQANTLVQSGSGAISFTGTAQGSTSDNYGIYQHTGAQVNTTSGNITYTGAGGNGTNDNYGIYLDGTNTQISSDNGTISLTGNSGGTGTKNYGISQRNAAQVSTTSGNISYDGEGGTGGLENFGIFLSETGSNITSTTGTINLTGTSVATTGGSNSGIRLVNGQVSGGGNISLTGEAGNGDSFNDGVVLLDNALIQGDGNASITLTGTGGVGTGNLNRGIVQQNGARVITANGNIIYSGEGGSGVNTNLGIDLTGASTTITSGAGDISLTGTGGGSGGFNYGIFQQLGAQVFTGTGNISYEGTGSGTADSIRTQDGSNLIGNGTTSGNITLTALTNGITLNNVTFETTGNIQISSPGNVTQNAVSSLQATGLELLGAGNFTLNQANEIGALAANTTGTINFTTTQDLDLSTVNTTNGITADTLILNITGGLSQSQPITLQNLGITATGDVLLENPTNEIQTLGADLNFTGELSVVTTTDLTIDTVNPDGIENAVAVLLQAGGDIILDQEINVIDDITLVAANNFINNAGANALQPSSGRWLVYSTRPEANQPGGLTGSEQFGLTYPGVPSFAGNGFIFSEAAPIAPLAPPSLTQPLIVTTISTTTITTPGVTPQPSQAPPPQTPTTENPLSVLTPVDLPLPSGLSTILQGQEEDEMPLEQSLCQLLEEGEEIVLEIDGVPVESALVEECREVS